MYTTEKKSTNTKLFIVWIVEVTYDDLNSSGDAIVFGRRAFVANNTNLGFQCYGKYFLPFDTILARVGYAFCMNKRLKFSDNKNQCFMKSQILC